MTTKNKVKILSKRIDFLEEEIRKIKKKIGAENFRPKLISPKIIERAYDNWVVSKGFPPKYVLVPEHWSVTINVNDESLGCRWRFSSENKKNKYY